MRCLAGDMGIDGNVVVVRDGDDVSGTEFVERVLFGATELSVIECLDDFRSLVVAAKLVEVHHDDAEINIDRVCGSLLTLRLSDTGEVRIGDIDIP